MTSSWKYRGAEITTDEEGNFEVVVHGERITTSSLKSIKTKIAARLDRRRKFEIECFICQVEGIDFHDRNDEECEVTSGLATYRGYNLTTGHPRFTFAKVDDEIYITWDMTLYAFPAEGDGKPLALRRLEEAIETYRKARALFQEKLEKLQHFRLAETVTKGAGCEVEKRLAERLTKR